MVEGGSVGIWPRNGTDLTPRPLTVHQPLFPERLKPNGEGLSAGWTFWSNPGTEATVIGNTTTSACTDDAGGYAEVPLQGVGVMAERCVQGGGDSSVDDDDLGMAGHL